MKQKFPKIEEKKEEDVIEKKKINRFINALMTLFEFLVDSLEQVMKFIFDVLRGIAEKPQWIILICFIYFGFFSGKPIFLTSNQTTTAQEGAAICPIEIPTISLYPATYHGQQLVTNYTILFEDKIIKQQINPFKTNATSLSVGRPGNKLGILSQSLGYYSDYKEMDTPCGENSAITAKLDQYKEPSLFVETGYGTRIKDSSNLTLNRGGREDLYIYPTTRFSTITVVYDYKQINRLSISDTSPAQTPRGFTGYKEGTFEVDTYKINTDLKKVYMKIEASQELTSTEITIYLMDQDYYLSEEGIVKQGYYDDDYNDVGAKNPKVMVTING